MKHLGGRLREQRRRLGASAVETAEAAQISRQTLHRIESGEPSVTAAAWAAVAQALGLGLALHESNGAPEALAHARGSIPIRIRLTDYPELKRLAWQLDEEAILSPAEALGIYERNQRHLDEKAMQAPERQLLEDLRTALRDEHRDV
ncbi:helix-turn-helix domain-containing protein [Caenimonas sp. SL110]|uniref:helix-turn-helix domain-containing protein n=1 Tax=Caenimonas sp. SL110 TaxID=1450524 RepID=UPI0018732546|nr:helix-turn-helix transcriptional regulator [Caenimonas sp. SL110]